MKRKQLPRKKAKEILEKLGIKRGNVEVIEENNIKVYLINGEPLFFEKSDKILPTIFYFLKFGVEKFVVVDDGAKKKILKGADVLRPGIIEFSDFKKDDVVAILDSKNSILAVGIALIDSEEAKKLEKGKVIKNLHYFGDKIFKILRVELGEKLIIEKLV